LECNLPLFAGREIRFATAQHALPFRRISNSGATGVHGIFWLGTGMMALMYPYTNRVAQ